MQKIPHEFSGTHIFGELYGIDPKLLSNAELIEHSLKQGVLKSGATLCGVQVKNFEPAGLTLLALLSESHASVHTYPEFRSLFFDAFTCGHCKPQEIADQLILDLKPEYHSLSTLQRGLRPHGSLPSATIPHVIQKFDEVDPAV